MKKTSVHDCTLIELPKIINRSGNITHVTNEINIPFSVKRIFYLYDIPGGEDRGAHSHKQCHQFLVAASGSFEVKLNDSIDEKTITLNRPDRGLYIPPGIWAAEILFSSGAVCLVLVSHIFDENDYVRDYTTFVRNK
jgi:hypothetical protein